MSDQDAPCADAASDIINVFIRALAEAFDPDSDCPPDGGGSNTVRFFAGEGAPLAAWNSHATGDGCEHPFLWVRAIRRYRSKVFPTPTVEHNPCRLPRVIAVEIGVARCAVVELEPDWDDYAREAEISLDDSYRIELALCRAATLLGRAGVMVATDTIAAFGPEGGVVAWTGIAYATIERIEQ